MPISSKLFVRSTLILLAAASLMLLAIVATVIWLGEQSQVYFDDVIEARDARTAAVDLRNALRVAETSQRGFLITQDAAYLDGYARASEVLPERIGRLKEVLAPYHEADAAVAEMEQTIAAKVSEMEQTIDLTNEGKPQEAFALVKTDAGKALMDKTVEFLGSVITAADDRLTEGVAQQRGNASWLRWVSIIGGIVIVAVVGGAAITVWRYTKELAEARDEVNALNADLEKRVTERTADLAQANEEIQRFAYIVTHDLRAPLVNIMGFTSELEESVKSVQALIGASAEASDDPVADQARLAATEDLPEAIGFIRSSTRKMDGLINAILKLSREGKRVLKAERLDAKALLRGSVEAIQHLAADNGGEVAIDVNVPPIESDRLSLEQIFGNLLDNAVKYRSPERPLRIAIRGAVAPGNRVAFEVSDNGRGIAAQDAERVFELFRRSGVQDQPGEGIGLAYVRTVVRNLGGDITMNSTLGEGTTFRILLPRILPTAGSAVK